MKRVLVVSTVVMALILVSSASAQPWEGSGTEADPYQIDEPNELEYLSQNSGYWTACFELTSNITIPGAMTIDPIGNGTTNFTGIFDGNDFTISNFHYTSTGTDFIGLFGYIGTDGALKNLGLEDPNIDSGDGDYVGGLVGMNFGTIINCYATGSVAGGDNSWNLGGLVGINRRGSISYCYAIGSVAGEGAVGGLVGQIEDGNVIYCYSTGSVAGEGAHGGLVGLCRNGRISNCYWDIETSGQTTSDGGTGKTTQEMQQQATYVGWDFVGESANGTSQIWQMPSGGGYPQLSSFDGYIPPVLSGSGTESDPYLINDPNELGAMYHYDMESYYQLESDINLVGIKWSNAVIPFFAGVFDGNDFTVSNFHYTSTGIDYIGLFGYVSTDGAIKNLGLKDPNIDSGDGNYVGALVGENFGTIINCSTTGAVTGGDDSYSIGGLVGRNLGSISNCYAIGAVNCGDYSLYLGGLVGVNGHWSSNGNISNCYATVAVTGGNNSVGLGGLVGQNDLYGSIINCYATGAINGGDYSWYLGGLVGESGGSISNCYWDIETSGTTDGVGNQDPDPAGVMGRTTAQMQQHTTFVGWDFIWEQDNGSDDIWMIPIWNSSTHYPALAWQNAATADLAYPFGVALEDYAVLANAWLSDNTPSTHWHEPCDLNHDGIINTLDLMLLQENYLKGR